MNTQSIKEIGTINIEKIEVAEGQLELRIPVDVIAPELENLLDKEIECFKKKSPEVRNVSFEPRIVFSFGRWNTEFTLMLIIFDMDNKENVEFLDDIKISLSEDMKKQLKRSTWNKLGDAILGL